MPPVNNQSALPMIPVAIPVTLETSAAAIAQRALSASGLPPLPRALSATALSSQSAATLSRATATWIQSIPEEEWLKLFDTVRMRPQMPYKMLDQLGPKVGRDEKIALCLYFFAFSYKEKVYHLIGKLWSNMVPAVRSAFMPQVQKVYKYINKMGVFSLSPEEWAPIKQKLEEFHAFREGVRATHPYLSEMATWPIAPSVAATSASSLAPRANRTRSVALSRAPLARPAPAPTSLPVPRQGDAVLAALQEQYLHAIENLRRHQQIIYGMPSQMATSAQPEIADWLAPTQDPQQWNKLCVLFKKRYTKFDQQKRQAIATHFRKYHADSIEEQMSFYLYFYATAYDRKVHGLLDLLSPNYDKQKWRSGYIPPDQDIESFSAHFDLKYFYNQDVPHESVDLERIHACLHDLCGLGEQLAGALALRWPEAPELVAKPGSEEPQPYISAAISIPPSSSSHAVEAHDEKKDDVEGDDFDLGSSKPQKRRHSDSELPFDMLELFDPTR
jgi:hypothetical protein